MKEPFSVSDSPSSHAYNLPFTMQSAYRQDIRCFCRLLKDRLGYHSAGTRALEERPVQCQLVSHLYSIRSTQLHQSHFKWYVAAINTCVGGSYPFPS